MKIKYLFLAGLLLPGIVFYSENTSGQDVSSNHVAVYYFHGNFRCSNCYKIEQYTKETVEKYFSNELKSGRLEYKTVNVDEPQNKHFADDYELYTKSVVVSLVKNGKEAKYNNLTKVWEFLWDKDGFCNYVREEVNSCLKEL